MTYIYDTETVATSKLRAALNGPEANGWSVYQVSPTPEGDWVIISRREGTEAEAQNACVDALRAVPSDATCPNCDLRVRTEPARSPSPIDATDPDKWADEHPKEDT